MLGLPVLVSAGVKMITAEKREILSPSLGLSSKPSQKIETRETRPAIPVLSEKGQRDSVASSPRRKKQIGPCVTPVYHTRCPPNTYTRVFYQVRGVRLCTPTTFHVRGARLPNQKCEVHSSPTTVSGSNQRVTGMTVYNGSTQPVMLENFLNIAVLSTRKGVPTCNDLQRNDSVNCVCMMK